jgi:hypothetical protein
VHTNYDAIEEASVFVQIEIIIKNVLRVHKLTLQFRDVLTLKKSTNESAPRLINLAAVQSTSTDFLHNRNRPNMILRRAEGKNSRCTKSTT